jgi:hypothetical protein
VDIPRTCFEFQAHISYLTVTLFTRDVELPCIVALYTSAVSEVRDTVHDAEVVNTFLFPKWDTVGPGVLCRRSVAALFFGRSCSPAQTPGIRLHSQCAYLHVLHACASRMYIARGKGFLFGTNAASCWLHSLGRFWKRRMVGVRGCVLGGDEGDKKVTS